MWSALPLTVLCATISLACFQVAAWYSEMAAHVRSLDSRHMISTGEAGFDIQPGQNKDQCNPCADSPPPGSSAVDHLFLANPFNISRNAINGTITFPLQP